MEDAVERLTYAILGEQDRKLCFLVGSGVSIPVAPSTAAMCDHMYSELDMKTARPDHQTGSEYRQLAEAMKRRRGVHGLPRLLRRILDPDRSAERPTPIESDAWELPKQQRGLAQLISLLPAHRRGPVFTTNFDPLTEVALHREGVHAQAVIASGASTVNLDALVETVPVVHLHGFWTVGPSLNTDAELLTARPGVEDEVLRSVQDCLVVILGYGGWDDAFTRTVEKNLRSGRFSATGTEFAWMHHTTPGANRSQFLSDVSGMAQIVEYSHVDIAQLVAQVAARIASAELSRGPGIRGIWPVAPTATLARPTKSDLWGFLGGSEPLEAVSRNAPRLSAFVKIEQAVKQNIGDDEEDVFVVATGPTGEGKSVALKQIAHTFSGKEGLKVFNLEVGSPPLGQEAIETLRRQDSPVLVLIDEADLVIDGIASALSRADAAGNRLTFVCAMHSQFRDKIEYWKRNVGRWVLVDIDGIDEADASHLSAILAVERSPAERLH